MIENPSIDYVIKVLRANYVTLANYVNNNEQLLPDFDHPKVLGCGSWGCVFATRVENIVLKITFSENEVEFVNTTLKMQSLNKNRPFPGIVMFFDVCQLGRHKAWAIWRSAVDMIPIPIGEFQQILIDITSNSLALGTPHGLGLLEVVKGAIDQDLNDERTYEALKGLWEDFQIVNKYWRGGAKTLLFFAKHGWLIVDLNPGNLGTDPLDGSLVILDAHIVELTPDQTEYFRNKRL